MWPAWIRLSGLGIAARGATRRAHRVIPRAARGEQQRRRSEITRVVARQRPGAGRRRLCATASRLRRVVLDHLVAFVRVERGDPEHDRVRYDYCGAWFAWVSMKRATLFPGKSCASEQAAKRARNVRSHVHVPEGNRARLARRTASLSAACRTMGDHATCFHPEQPPSSPRHLRVDDVVNPGPRDTRCRRDQGGARECRPVSGGRPSISPNRSCAQGAQLQPEVIQIQAAGKNSVSSSRSTPSRRASVLPWVNVASKAAMRAGQRSHRRHAAFRSLASCRAPDRQDGRGLHLAGVQRGGCR